MLNHDDNTHHLYPNNVFTHSLVRALVIPMIPLYLLSTCSLLALSLSLLIGCGGIRFFYWDLFTRVTHRHHVPRDGGGGSTVILYNRYRNEIATLHRSSTHTHTHTHISAVHHRKHIGQYVSTGCILVVFTTRYSGTRWVFVGDTCLTAGLLDRDVLCGTVILVNTPYSNTRVQCSTYPDFSKFAK
jgi:hypothetical protein